MVNRKRDARQLLPPPTRCIPRTRDLYHPSIRVHPQSEGITLQMRSGEEALDMYPIGTEVRRTADDGIGEGVGNGKV